LDIRPVAGVAGPFENRLDVPDKTNLIRLSWCRRLLPICLRGLSIPRLSKHYSRKGDQGDWEKPLLKHLRTTRDDGSPGNSLAKQSLWEMLPVAKE
jgi:hypothetical protein